MIVNDRHKGLAWSRMPTGWTDIFSWNSSIKSRPCHSLFLIQIWCSSYVSFHFLQICRVAPQKLVVPGQGVRQTKRLRNMHQQQDLSRLTIQVSNILFPFHWFPICKTNLCPGNAHSKAIITRKTCHFVYRTSDVQQPCVAAELLASTASNQSALPTCVTSRLELFQCTVLMLRDGLNGSRKTLACVVDVLIVLLVVVVTPECRTRNRSNTAADFVKQTRNNLKHLYRASLDLDFGRHALDERRQQKLCYVFDWAMKSFKPLESKALKSKWFYTIWYAVALLCLWDFAYARTLEFIGILSLPTLTFHWIHNEPHYAALNWPRPCLKEQNPKTLDQERCPLGRGSLLFQR